MDDKDLQLTLKTLKLGDLNGDNQINKADYDKLFNSIKNNTANGKGDVNEDGIVDLKDLVLLNKVWQNAGSLGAGGSGLDYQDVYKLMGDLNSVTPGKPNGDINGDGQKNSADLEALQKFITTGDVNKDGKITIADFKNLLQSNPIDTAKLKEFVLALGNGDLNKNNELDADDIVL